MKTKLPEIEIPDAEGWKFTEEGTKARGDHKSFRAVPKERLVVDYLTWEKYRGRYIEVVYPAEIVDVVSSHWWYEDAQNWRSSTNIRVRLLNSQTMEPYSPRNPLSEIRHIRDRAFQETEELPTSRSKIERVVLDATTPKTKIVINITEEPLSA
jgi:hypothetical protein